MNQERWVDSRVEQVRVAQLRSYLADHGWAQRPFGRPQVLLFEGPADDEGRPLRQWVPASEDLVDYRRGIVDVITSLSVLEERSPIAVLDDILRQAATESANGAEGTIPSSAPMPPAL